MWDCRKFVSRIIGSEGGNDISKSRERLIYKLSLLEPFLVFLFVWKPLAARQVDQRKLRYDLSWFTLVCIVLRMKELLELDRFEAEFYLEYGMASRALSVSYGLRDSLAHETFEEA